MKRPDNHNFLRQIEYASAGRELYQSITLSADFFQHRRELPNRRCGAPEQLLNRDNLVIVADLDNRRQHNRD